MERSQERVVATEFIEAEIDFDGVAKELAKLAPPKVTLEQVLGRLRDTMLEQKAKGVTLKQMLAVLEGRGISVSERKLRTFLETGEMGPGRKPAGIARAAAAPAEGGGDKF